ncbi:MAG: hypothetical protein ACT4PM_07340 [Gemmatimonadales bacterium]
MKISVRIGALGLGAALVAVLVSTCGGDGTGTSGDATTIDEESAARGIQQVSNFLPVCRQGTSSLQLHPGGDPPILRTVWLARLLMHPRRNSLRAGGDPANFLPPTQPDDEFGDCGGRITFPSYNHSSGTTTGTLEFDNFCTIDEETGAYQIADGRVSFTDVGTPSSGGPITTAFEADSPNGVTFTTETPSGSTITNHKITFSDFLYDVGVPGGTPNAGNPDIVTLDDARFTDLESGKTYRQSNYTFTNYQDASGNEFTSFSGRSFRSNGEYFDVATTTPLTLNSFGNVVSGQVVFTGAGGTSAVMTFVPGPILQVTMTVNGTPATNVPACQ